MKDEEEDQLLEVDLEILENRTPPEEEIVIPPVVVTFSLLITLISMEDPPLRYCQYNKFGIKKGLDQLDLALFFTNPQKRTGLLSTLFWLVDHNIVNQTVIFCFLRCHVVITISVSL